jgi:hypothetical protein
VRGSGLAGTSLFEHDIGPSARRLPAVWRVRARHCADFMSGRYGQVKLPVFFLFFFLASCLWRG